MGMFWARVRQESEALEASSRPKYVHHEVSFCFNPMPGGHMSKGVHLWAEKMFLLLLIRRVTTTKLPGNQTFAFTHHNAQWLLGVGLVEKHATYLIFTWVSFSYSGCNGISQLLNIIYLLFFTFLKLNYSSNLDNPCGAGNSSGIDMNCLLNFLQHYRG